MRTFEYTVASEHGIHARPAGRLVSCAKRFTSEIRITNGEREADAKQLLSVMSLGGRRGDVLTFTVVGEDEESAARELEQLCREHIS